VVAGDFVTISPFSVKAFCPGSRVESIVYHHLPLFNFDPYFTALLSAAFGFLALSTLYLVTQDYFSNSMAATSAFILATSVPSVLLSRMFLPESFLPTLSIIFFAVFTQVIKRRLNTTWLYLTLIFLVFCHPSFLLLAPLIAFLPSKLSTKPTLVWLVILILIAFLPFQPKLINPEFSSLPIQTWQFFSWYSIMPTLIILISTLLVLFFKRPPQTQFLLIWSLLALLSSTLWPLSTPFAASIAFVPLALLIARAYSFSPTFWKPLFAGILIFTGIVNAHFLVSRDFLVSLPQANLANPFGYLAPPFSTQASAITLIKSLNQPVNLNYHTNVDLTYLLLLHSIPTSSTGLPIYLYSSLDSPPANHYLYHFDSLVIAVPLQ